jgi:hypothetical protein
MAIRLRVDGGGMYLSQTNATISNNVLYKNKGITGAGGIQADSYGTIQSLNNTIVGNEAGNSSYGGGMQVASNCTVKNCIFWDNKAASSSERHSRDSSYCILLQSPKHLVRSGLLGWN